MAKPSSEKFEKNLQALEDLVEKLEQGDLPLEDALKAFEQGIKLARSCQGALQKAEQKIQILTDKEAAADASAFSPEDE